MLYALTADVVNVDTHAETHGNDSFRLPAWELTSMHSVCRRQLAYLARRPLHEVDMFARNRPNACAAIIVMILSY